MWHHGCFVVRRRFVQGNSTDAAEREHAVRTLRTLAVALVVALGSAMEAAAITTTLDPSSAIYQAPNSPSTYGVDLDGLARLTIQRTDGTFTCSAALLPTRTHLLTAAHCLASQSNAINVSGTVTASFVVDGVAESRLGASYWVHPLWNPSNLMSVDLAVIQLSSASTATGYSLYRNSVYQFEDVVIAGWGRSGTGATGSTLSSGTLRVATNSYDATWGGIGNPFAFDFDDGDPLHDSFGLLNPSLADTGNGAYEGLIASGDSGGASFLGGQIVGVHSFITSGGLPYDALPSSPPNSSFGDGAGDANVPMWAAWIDSIVPVPHPATFVLLVSAIGALAALRRRV